MMHHLRIFVATTKRILLQLSHDPRTIVLMLGAPILLMWLLSWVFEHDKRSFTMIAPALLGVFPFVIMFLVTSITTLRERSGGTLERLMAMPVGKLDIIAGYACAFGLLGAVQSLLSSTFAIRVLGMDVAGPQWFVIVVAILDTLLGVAAACGDTGTSGNDVPDLAAALPSCTDGIKNGSETDIDCGSACEVKCSAGKACSAMGDCAAPLLCGSRCSCSCR